MPRVHYDEPSLGNHDPSFCGGCYHNLQDDRGHEERISVGPLGPPPEGYRHRECSPRTLKTIQGPITESDRRWLLRLALQPVRRDKGTPYPCPRGQLSLIQRPLQDRFHGNTHW